MCRNYLGACAALLLIGSPLSVVAQGNPLGAANPLAGAPAGDPYVGSFSDGRLTLDAKRSGAGYAGRIQFSGNQYAFTAQPAGTALAGHFSDGDRQFPLSIRAEGGVLLLETGGTQYRLQSSGQAGGLAAAPNGGDPVLARGTYAVLTQDNAAAYVEALRFVLGQLGAGQLLQGVSDQQLYAQLARGFSAGSPEDQLGLAVARERWNATRAGWDALSQAAKLEFARDVVYVAWGDQGLARLGLGDGVGQGGGGGGSGGGGVGGFDINPNYPGSDCWASAGCTDYDAGSGTYTYEDYDYDTGSYDYSYSQ